LIRSEPRRYIWTLCDYRLNAVRVAPSRRHRMSSRRAALVPRTPGLSATPPDQLSRRAAPPPRSGHRPPPDAAYPVTTRGWGAKPQLTWTFRLPLNKPRASARTIAATASGTPSPGSLRGALALLIPRPVWQSAVNTSDTTVKNSVNIHPTVKCHNRDEIRRWPDRPIAGIAPLWYTCPIHPDSRRDVGAPGPQLPRPTKQSKGPMP
jgi:hypothetical protein